MATLRKKIIKQQLSNIHTKKILSVILLAIFLFFSNNIKANEIVHPLPIEEVKPLIKQLNSQGQIITLDKNLKRDKISGINPDNSSFYLEGSDAWYFLYKADINNDGNNEFILCSASGSGGFFDIDAIYQDKDGKLTDIFNDIKIPMRKLIRDINKESYDITDGYLQLANGSLTIEKENGKTFFTLKEVTRDYDSPEFKFNEPKSYKFLWDKNINLVKE